VHTAPEFPLTPLSVREARVWLGDVLEAEQVDDEPSRVCVLLLDELVTNALVHAGSSVLVRVDVDETGASTLVEVTNHGTEGRVDLVPYERGRPARHFGLHLVEALAANWGVRRDRGDTTVWFSLPSREEEARPGARAGRPVEGRGPVRMPGRAIRNAHDHWFGRPPDRPADHGEVRPR
jgi:anti-sigma regulatory factor (Ser/Thr protein kinase)